MRTHNIPSCQRKSKRSALFLLTVIGSNYPCLELIFIFEPCCGLPFTVMHRQLRVRAPQKSSIFKVSKFDIFTLKWYSFKCAP